MVRVKYRYFVVKLTAAPHGKVVQPSVGNLVESLKGICLKSYGDIGLASVQSLKIKFIDEVSPIFIMRLRHGSHRYMISILPLVKQIDGNLLKLETLFTTSTIKRCYMFLVENSEKILLPEMRKTQPKGSKVAAT